MDFTVTLDAVVTEEADGRFSAEVPALPGCCTWANSLEELREHLQDAAEGWLKVKHEMEQVRPDREAATP